MKNKNEEIQNPKSAADARHNQLLKERIKLEKEGYNLAEKALGVAKENAANLKKQGSFTNALTGENEKQVLLQQVLTKKGKVRAGVTKATLRSTLDTVKAMDEQTDAIKEQLPGLIGFAEKMDGIEKTINFISNGTKYGVAAGIGIAVGAALALQKAVTDTRKELGVSQTQAAGITLQNKALGILAKGYGLTTEDIVTAQSAIRKDLGASVQESINLSLNFARTAAATGQTADELSTTLSLMESISSASRDVLLNQLRTTAAIAGEAGVTPALVMKDLAQNAGFFASFAKDGGMNIVNASIAARKLGLELSAAADMANSLLDFESSIEAQLEASLLLGRQINMDKARQLAFTGDIEGMQREILKQVGGEAEFAKMSYLQRQKTAAAAGTTVENLARMVRNNTTGATGAAAGAAMSGGGDNRMLNTTVEMKDEIKGLRRDIRDR